MNEQSFSRILGRCLDRIAADEQAGVCLADYPEHAAELAPLLAAAAEMGVLPSYRISDAGRQRMRTQILNAEIVRNQQRASSRWHWPALAFGVPRLATGFIVALLCVVVTSAAVAASQPGDLAYGVRVAAERVPALLTGEPQARARAELGIAERRLGDLHRTRQGQAVDERAVAALLNSVDDLTGLAAGLPDAERAEVAARLQKQAQHLARLGDIAGSDGNRASLQGAALQVRLAAERIWPPTPQPGEPPPAGPTATATPAASATPLPTGLVPGKGGPTRWPVGSHTPLPSNTPVPGGPASSATPKGPGPNGTAQGHSASATPKGLAASATPQRPGPSGTAQGPGSSATPQGRGASSTPQGPGPIATQQGPGASATPQGPGPSATPQGRDPNSTAEGPGPSAMSQEPGPNATPQGPGPGSTPGGPRS